MKLWNCETDIGDALKSLRWSSGSIRVLNNGVVILKIWCSKEKNMSLSDGIPLISIYVHNMYMWWVNESVTDNWWVVLFHLGQKLSPHHRWRKSPTNTECWKKKPPLLATARVIPLLKPAAIIQTLEVSENDGNTYNYVVMWFTSNVWQ